MRPLAEELGTAPTTRSFRPDPVDGGAPIHPFAQNLLPAPRGERRGAAW